MIKPSPKFAMESVGLNQRLIVITSMDGLILNLTVALYSLFVDPIYG